MEIVLRRNPDDRVAANIGLLISSTLVSLLLALAFSAIGDHNVPIFVLSFVPALIAIAFNFRLILAMIVIVLFINIHYDNLSSSVWLSTFIPLSFFICFKKIKRDEFKQPLTLSLLIYLATMIISLVNSIDVLFSLYLMYNMVAFIMVIYICAVAIRSENEIFTYTVLFLLLTFLNSLQVISEGISATRRVFGFAGIMFVDYVGVAITMTFTILLTARGKKYRIFWLTGIIIFIAALLITQTRNAWLATFLSLFSLMIIMIIKAKKLEMRRAFLILSLTLSLFIATILVLTVATIKPEVSKRAEETTKVEESVSKSGLIQSSLLMRVFIWHTAYTAFLEHPIIGIGAYSFPFSSQEYYRVPKFIFEEYVDGVTPHQTFFAVAVETGLLGLFAFLFFLISSLKISFDSINYAKTFEEKSFSLLLFSPLLYISISMTMTDAWLWGHGIILWGILIGFNLWNRKKLIEKYLSVRSEDIT